MCRKSQKEEENEKADKEEEKREVRREKVEKFSGDLRDRKENCTKNANAARKSARRRGREGAQSGWLA